MKVSYKQLLKLYAEAIDNFHDEVISIQKYTYSDFWTTESVYKRNDVVRTFNKFIEKIDLINKITELK